MWSPTGATRELGVQIHGGPDVVPIIVAAASAQPSQQMTQRLRQLPVKQFLQLYPSCVARRLLKGFLLQFGGTTALRNYFKVNIAASRIAHKAVSGATAYSAHLMVRSPGVSSGIRAGERSAVYAPERPIPGGRAKIRSAVCHV